VQDSEEDPSRRIAPRRPRHRLGVASLALDTSTQLSGRNAPEGILYTGGRDGQVISWDLGVAMKKKDSSSAKTRRDHLAVGRWEVMTGWADDYIDEEAEENEERLGSDGDVLGDVVPSSSRRRRPSKSSSLVLRDDQWETDLEAFKPGQVCISQPRAFAVNDLTYLVHTAWSISTVCTGAH
jgi:WD repeat-containing protein 48